MNSTEFQTSPVPDGVLRAKPRHIEDLGDVTKELLDEIRSGRVYLKAVGYPWGVEFDLCERGAAP